MSLDFGMRQLCLSLWTSGLPLSSIGLVALFSCLPGGVAADPTTQVPIGPRAIAMGGAYTSLAQDASAMFWNPAGLSGIEHQEIAGSYANLYQSNVRDNLAAFVLPISRRVAVGMDWYHSGFNDSELEFGENRFDLSYSNRPSRLLSLGVTAKYLTRNTALDGSEVGRGNGFGMDFGALATPLRGLRVGLIIQDAFDTSIHYTGGASTLAFPRNIRAGASYSYRDRATLAVDVDDRWHVGTEVRPMDLLFLRAGMEDDRTGPESPTFTAGAGLTAGIFRLDYAYVMHPTLESTSHFGLAVAFNFNPAQIRIERVDADEVFTSLYQSYGRHPFGHATLRNLQDKPLETRFSVFIPELMEEPSEQTVVIGRGASETVPLIGEFSDKSMAVQGNFRTTVRVAATYKSSRLERTDRSSAPVTVYAPGVIDWNQGLEQTAAFITVRDPVVDSVATRAVHAAATLGRTPFGTRNVTNAVAIFDALGTLGVIYVPDSNDPYPVISEKPRAVDRVNYPRQTLEKRTGDCDDTTVLCAALFGNVGIPTKLVDVPGHLFLLIDTGRHERDLRYMGVDPELFVVVDQGLWIPVETTVLGHGFAEAWRSGADRYASASANHALSLVDVSAAQSEFEQGQPSGTPLVPALDVADLTTRIHRDAERIADWRTQYVESISPTDRTQDSTSVDGLDVVARVEYLAGRLEDAIGHLESQVLQRPRSARAHNNLGNALAAQGQLASAIAHYEEALDIDEADAGIWLNAGLVSSAMGDSARSSRFLDEGLRRCGGYEPACRLLGLSTSVPVDRAGLPQLSREESRRLLRETIERGAVLKSLRPVTGAATAPRRQMKPLRMIPAVTRASGEDEGDVRLHLYWREEQ